MHIATVIGVVMVPPLYYIVQSTRERLKGAPRGAAQGEVEKS